MSKLKIKTKERRFETAGIYTESFLKTLTVPETEDFIRKCFETEASKIRFTGGLYTAGGWHPCKNRIRMAG